MTKKELIEKLKSVHTTGGSGSYYKMLEIVQEYGDSYMEEFLVSDIIDEDVLDDMVRREAEDGARRVFCFLDGIEWWDDAYRINGYGNVENLTEEYLSGVLSDLIDIAEDLDDEDEEEDEEDEDDDEE